MQVKERKKLFDCKICKSPTSALVNTKRFERQLCSDCFGKKEDRRPKELNDLSGAEWAKFSLSVQEYPDVRTEKQREHGACYPISLVKQFIQKYTKKGDTVFDPFSGVGTTHDACVDLQRNCLGIEINAKFSKIARASLPMRTSYLYKIITDDAVFLDNHIKSESIDFILTSPPYSNLLKNVNGSFAFKWKEHSLLPSIANPKPYSNKTGDLGNMEYSKFFTQLHLIMNKLYHVLKDGKYMAWVVKDFRNLKKGMPYVNFHGDVIEYALHSNFLLWDIIIYDQTKFRPLVCLGYPSKRYYHNIGHSYILVFRKGNT